MHPALRDRGEDLHATLLRLLAYVCGLAVLSIAAAHVFQPPPPDVVVVSKPSSDWIEVERPHPAFDLTIPEAADAPQSYAIRRHRTGNGRKDILGLGDPNGAGPYLHLEVYRPGTEIEAFKDPIDEVASRTMDMRIEGLRPSEEPLSSKFGPMSIVTFDTRDVLRRCLGFARTYDDPRLEIVGWFCQGGSELIERSMLTCALDRFTLISAGSEPKVGALFARAELQRQFCGQRSTLLAPTPKYKMLWAAIAQSASAKARNARAEAR